MGAEMKVIEVPGANGTLHMIMKAKQWQRLMSFRRHYDYVHSCRGSDEMGHQGSAKNVQSIEYLISE